jgi:hypothetical protein
MIMNARHQHAVMAGLDPAIHALTHDENNVDARDEPGHDDVVGDAP